MGTTVSFVYRGGIKPSSQSGSVLLQTLAYGGNDTEAEGSDNARWNAGIADSVYIPAI